MSDSRVAPRPAPRLGQLGERAAAGLLRRRGYEVIGTGFRARRGELDLVCRRGDALVVVEVKTRTDDSYGTPFEAVGSKKRQALTAAAREYRAMAEWRGPIRFAVVGLTVNRLGRFDAELIEDPFG
ncbi:MAG: YraN family protein [Candidatus Dormibacterales bacterium]